MEDGSARARIGPSRLSAAASQAARDRSRSDASRDVVAGEVIAFQVAQQQARLSGAAEFDPGRLVASLSAREREVLGLLAAGRSDGEIAADLFISKKTASVHVANIKGKLGAASRVEIALLSRRVGLGADGTLDATAAGAAGEVVSRGSRGSEPVVCPFKGLASFDVSDGPFFFGRERDVADVIARLAASGVVAVVGPSGSGKSSVLRAGVVPSLRAGVLPGSAGWPVVITRPREQPFAELSRRVEAALGMARDGDGSVEAGQWLDALAPGDRLVLVVDQIEEAFTNGADPSERARYFDALVALATDPDRRTAVVVAIRSDLYGRFSEHRGMAELLGGATVLLGAMAPSDLTRAIELPARAAGLRLDPNLAPALVADVLEQPGGLPLLSVTLLELWGRRDGRTMRLDAYRALGGISGAVARNAEAVHGRLTTSEQALSRAIFLRLTRPDGESGALRRQARLAELDADRDPSVARVLALLVENRLVTIDDDHVELAHEALLREWPRMRAWLDEDADGRRIRDHLARAAREWDAAGGDAHELYRGSRLAVAEEWAATDSRRLNELERRFLVASHAASTQELADQRHANTRLRRLLALSGVLLLAAVTAGVAAVIQAGVAGDQARLAADNATDAQRSRDAAERSARAARASALAAASTAAVTTDPTLARLLAITAADLVEPDLEIERALRQSWLADAIVARPVIPSDRAPGLIATSDPDGNRLAATRGFRDGDQPSVEVIDIDSGQVAWSYEPAWPEARVEPARFSADGLRVFAGVYWAPGAAGSEPPADALGVLVFDAVNGRMLQRIDTGVCGSRLIDVSEPWLLVAAASAPACFSSDAESGYSLVDPASGMARSLAVDTLGDVVLSRDGSVIAYTTTDEAIVMAETTTGRELLRLPLESAVQRDHGFRSVSDDGSLALYGDRPVLVLETATGSVLASLGSAEGEHIGTTFDAIGSTAFTSGRDATLVAWDPRSGDELFSVPTAGGGQLSVTRDGRVIVSDFASGDVAVVEPWLHGELASFATCRGFFPAGQLQIRASIAIVGGDCGNERLTYAIDTATWQATATMPDSDAQGVALSFDGARVARQTRVDDTTLGIEIDDARTGQMLVRLDGLCRWDGGSEVPRQEQPGCRPFPHTPFPLWALALRFSPDDQFVVGLDAEGYVAVWDARSGKFVRGFSPPAPGYAIVFSPDGAELLVATDDGILTYSTATWELVDRAVPGDDLGDGSGLTPFAFLPDGRIVAAQGLAGTGSAWLHVLDGQTLEPLWTVLAHEASMKSTAISLDGRLIATGASDGTVAVWDSADGTLLHVLTVPGQAQGLAFVDDRHIAITPQRGGVLVMTLDRAELVARVRASMTRSFTAEECARYEIDPCPSLEEVLAGGRAEP